MVDADLSSYITEKGWRVKGREQWDTVGWQIVLDCPLCGKLTEGGQRRFYVSEATGQWKSFCCDQDGNLVTLKRRLGDLQVKIIGSAGALDKGARGIGQALLRSRGGSAALSVVPDESKLPAEGTDDTYHAALLARPAAIDYITRPWKPGLPGRGLSIDTVRRAKLGFRPLDSAQASKLGTHEDHPEHGWICIPWYLPDGRLAGFKYRALPASEALGRFRREKGAPTVLYGAHEMLGASPQVVTLYEGELDRLSGDQLGLPFGLAATAGAGAWQADWTALLAGVSTIVIAYDADSSGDAGAEKVAEALGRWRCKRLRLPNKDANAALAGTETAPPATAKELSDAYMAMDAFDLASVKDAGSYGGLLTMTKAAATGGLVGVPELQALLGGLRGPELTVLSGETGHGKTTFATFWAWSLASVGGGPVLIASPEHTPEDEAMKLATMEAGRPFLDLDLAGRQHVLSKLTRKGIMLFDAYGQNTAETLFDTLRYFYLSCGGKFAVIDHLGFFVGEGERRQHEAIDTFLKTLAKLLVDELPGLHVVLIVHPKDAAREHGKPARLDMTRLKGSSGIRQLAWNVGFVERRERQDGKLRAYVWFEKIRSIYGEPGEVAFEFDRDSLRFTGLHALAQQAAAAGQQATASTTVKRQGRAKAATATTTATTTAATAPEAQEDEDE